MQADRMIVEDVRLMAVDPDGMMSYEVTGVSSGGNRYTVLGIGAPLVSVGDYLDIDYSALDGDPIITLSDGSLLRGVTQWMMKAPTFTRRPSNEAYCVALDTVNAGEIVTLDTGSDTRLANYSGEALRAGDAVYVGADGKVYKVQVGPYKSLWGPRPKVGQFTV